MLFLGTVLRTSMRATVYIQAHYLVDVIAGWISAVCIYIVATYMYKRWFASVVFQLVLK